MSGGSLNYVYAQVEDAAHSVAMRAQTPLHRAFAAHLMKVADALHDIEWLFSADYGPGQEVEAIRAVVTPASVLETATEHARAALSELQDAIKQSEHLMPLPAPPTTEPEQ